MLLLSFMLVSLSARAGNMQSVPSAAENSDPRLCSTLYPSVCDDPAEAAALDEFPGWDYRSTDNASGLMLGTANGALWMISCEHCYPPSGTVQFVSGPWAGVDYNVVANPDCGATLAWHQLGNPDCDLSGTGPLIYKLVPASGPLPEIPMLPILRTYDDIPQDALFLTLGTPSYSASATLGWFQECATTIAGGNPSAPTRDACCTTARASESFEAPQSPTQPCSIPNRVNASIYKHACYGGEGTFATCTDGTGPALTYLGPVWEASATSTWTTRRCRHYATPPLIRKRGAESSCVRWGGGTAVLFDDGGPSIAKQDDLALLPHHSVDAAFLAETCTYFELPGFSSDYSVATPPTARINTHSACHQQEVMLNLADVTQALGGSGTQLFVYVNDTWWYAGGAGAGSYGEAFVQKFWSEFSSVVYGHQPTGGAGMVR